MHKLCYDFKIELATSMEDLTFSKVVIFEALRDRLAYEIIIRNKMQFEMFQGSEIL